MPTPQQYADAALARYQELGPLRGEDRIQIMMEDFWLLPIELDTKYEDTMRRLSEAMSDES